MEQRKWSCSHTVCYAPSWYLPIAWIASKSSDVNAQSTALSVVSRATVYENGLEIHEYLSLAALCSVFACIIEREASDYLRAESALGQGNFESQVSATL